MCDINEETADDEDGLVVWQGRIAEYSDISGFVDEADLQRHPLAELARPTHAS